MRKVWFIALLALVALPFYAATGGGTVTVVADIAVAGFTLPTTALPAAVTPVFTDGSHLVKYGYVTATGISYLSAPGTTRTTDVAHTCIRVSVVASARTEVTSVNIYATKAGATTPFYLVKTLVANASADVDVGALDAALTSLAPTADTASATTDTTITSTTGYKFRSVCIRNTDATNRVYVTLDGTDPVTSTTTGSWSIGPGVTWGPLPLDPAKDGNNVTTIKMRFDTTGGIVTYWFREDY